MERQKPTKKELLDYYHGNKRFTSYVDGEARKHKVDIETILSWALTREMYYYLIDDERDKVLNPDNINPSLICDVSLSDDKSC